MNKGIYVHIPFCVSKCPYCDFYSAPQTDLVRGAYIDKLINEIEKCPFDFKADTIFFGGGTPTTIEPNKLVKLLDIVKTKFLVEEAEITIEANPGTVSYDTLSILSDGGFNRISFGTQAMSDKLLKNIGRIHSAKQGIEAIENAKKAGFTNISADLMLCIPGQELSDIKESIDILSDLDVNHISSYMLQIEEGTKFFDNVKTPPENKYVDFYKFCISYLKEKNYDQYEISNFSKGEKYKGKHNLHYWRDEEYLGIGPSAHSFIDGKRFFFARDLDKFLNSKNIWDNTIDDGFGGSEEERIMLGLRLVEGIKRESLSKETQDKFDKKTPALIKAGYIKYESDRYFLTTEGFLISNMILTELL